MKSQRATVRSRYAHLYECRAAPAERQRSRSEADTGQCFGPWVGLCFCDSQGRAGRSLRPRRPATDVAVGLAGFDPLKYLHFLRLGCVSLLPPPRRTYSVFCWLSLSHMALPLAANSLKETNAPCFCGSQTRAGRPPAHGRPATRRLRVESCGSSRASVRTKFGYMGQLPPFAPRGPAAFIPRGNATENRQPDHTGCKHRPPLR